jgi:ABC-2 type transport system ATP-binding protein
MHDPDLLILDEPTSGLDPLIQAEFNAIIKEHKARGKTTFISSHVLSEVQAICDRVGFIRDGQLINVTTLEGLLEHTPRNVMIHFANTAPKKEVFALPGLENLSQKGKLATFTYSGDINRLLRLLAGHKLKSLDIQEADLEDLFMNYYKKEATHV